MHPHVKKIIQDIHALRIQGARNVARAALRAMGIAALHSNAKKTDAFYRELVRVSALLSRSRPTEPMMRNYLSDLMRYAESVLKKEKLGGSEAKKSISRETDRLLKKIDRDFVQLAEHGAALIPDNAFVLTHCHSSTVVAILRKAKAMGKKLEVAALETRPLYQGHRTARELAESNIKVSLAVDGAMNLLMKRADLVLVGADAITSRGDLINKVGTSALAHVARMHDVSFYSAAELYKYSPATFLGQREKMEERDPKEVWDKAPRGVHILNPAFDVTAARYIAGYITEEGVVPPQSLFALATQKLGIKP